MRVGNKLGHSTSFCKQIRSLVKPELEILKIRRVGRMGKGWSRKWKCGSPNKNFLLKYLFASLN